MKPNIHTDIHCLSFWISSDLLLSFLKDLPFLRARLPCFTTASAKRALTKYVFNSPLSVSEYESGLRSKNKWLSIFIKLCLRLECSLWLRYMPSKLQFHTSLLVIHLATKRGTRVSPQHRRWAPRWQKLDRAPQSPPSIAEGSCSPGQAPAFPRGAEVSKRTRERDGMV